MKSLGLSFCLCCIFSSLVGAELYWNAYSECTAAEGRCERAKQEAAVASWNNRDDIERYRDTFRKQQEASSICSEKERICSQEREERARREAERQREEERRKQERARQQKELGL